MNNNKKGCPFCSKYCQWNDCDCSAKCSRHNLSPNSHAFHCMCDVGEFCAWSKPLPSWTDKWIVGRMVFDEWFFRKSTEIPDSFDRLFNL